MRVLAVIVLLGACRSALGIPGEFDIPGDGQFSLSGTVRGGYGASVPVTLTLDGVETITVTEDRFTFTGLENGAYEVTASSACTIANGNGTISDADVDGVEVTCDGLAGLESFGFSAPLSVAAPMVEMMEGGSSILTQSTRLAPEPVDAAATVSGLAVDGVPPAAETPLDDLVTFELTVRHPDVTPRAFKLEVRRQTPEEFGYGKQTMIANDARFGTAVAAAADLLVVGAPDRPGGGEAIVFRRTGRAWREEAVLRGAAGEGDRFGASVATDGTKILVGAPGESGAGAAYVFAAPGWVKMPVTGHVAVAGEDYGASVVLVAGKLAIAAPGAAQDAGKVYVIGGGVTTLAGQSAGDRFGAALAANGTRLVIGAPGESSLAPKAGAAYVYSAPAFGLDQVLRSTSPGAGDAFGSAIAIAQDDGVIAIGAPFEDSQAAGISDTVAIDNELSAAGAVFVFRRQATWTLANYLKAPNVDSLDEYGTSVALYGSVLVVGAPYEDSRANVVDGDAADNTLVDAGAVYVYSISPSSIAPGHYLKASRPGERDAFGSQIALTGELLVVGAPFEDSGATGWNGNQGDGAFDTGAVYTFR
jgi:hypothetical protein